MNRPKDKPMTAAQEAHLGQAEQCNMRARIIELGVKGFLADEGSPYSQGEATKAARDMLTDAIALRDTARTHHRNAFPEDFRRAPKAKSSKRPGSRASRR